MRFFGLFTLVLLLAGCASSRQPSSQTEESGKALSAHEPAESVGNVEPAAILKGKVLERIDADRYSYLRLSSEAGEIWAAVPQTGVQVGEEVAIVDPMPMDGFESKTLNRKFDRIMFGVLRPAGNEDVKQMLMQAHSTVSESESVGPIEVEKASGPYGYTIEEIFSRKLDLKDRKAAVRGRVTRVNPNILGKTWIHLQDGTGDPAAKTNDLAVTSLDTPSVGDTVLVEGVVHTDKNFGMGYVFSVILEDATVKKQ